MDNKYTKLKTYSIYGLYTIILAFCLLWIVDMMSSSFNPEYRPLLTFLEIASGLLRTIMGM